MLPTQLLPPLSSFVGHEDDLAELARLLAPSSLAAAAPDEARPAVRLLTLTGPGGIGKSRLAIEVAARLAAHYRDGAHAVPLAAIDDSELTAAAVAQATDINLSPGRRAGDGLCAALQNKHILLLLDNLDPVTSAAPLVADLLAAAPHLTFLVTSREPLHIPGEQEFPVPPLVLPDPRNLPPVEKLLDFSAIALFVQRARAVRPDFSLTSDSAPAAVRVCRGLDGLPLAIELAAARVKTLSVEQIAARLADCLDLLTQGDRTALPRHRTLRATIDWSYDLLAETERDLFRRLAIFPGSFTLAGAVAVGAVDGESSSALLDRLAVLVDKSLIMAIPAHAEVRYRILATIRRYALDKLAETGEMPAVQRRNLGYLLSGAEEAHQALSAGNRVAGLAWFDAERDNLRAALAWCTENSETEGALRLTVALEPFWHLSGEAREGRTWLGRLLSIDRTSSSRDGEAAQELIAENTHPARDDQSNSPPPDSLLRIFTLGPERVCLGSRVLTTTDWTYAKAREMLLYLACNSPRTKEQIGLALWPDASDNQLHNNFRVTLHHLRRALGRSEWIIFEDGLYRFNRSLPHQVDSEVYASCVAAAKSSLDTDQAIAHLKTAINLYAGDFLEALDSDWPLLHREGLRRLYQQALLLLGRLLFADTRYAEAMEVYHRALAQDSYLEAAHRGVMRCLIRLGERVQALRHYDALVALFEEEMGSPPAQRTVSLAEHLRQGHEV